MRNIGFLNNEQDARRFGDFLYVNGIPNNVEPDQLHWVIWVHDDDHLTAARDLLAKFQSNPASPEFAAAAEARNKRTEEERDLAAYQKRMKKGRDVVSRLGFYGMGPLTSALMAISIAVSLYSGLGGNEQKIMALFITKWKVMGPFLQWEPGLPEIRHGEIWRLFTPMFIHFGLMHILFNMLWLRDLGTFIEGRESTWRLLLLVVLISAGSNLAQYGITVPGWRALSGGAPNFGGMSGVVYGLLGYIWMRAKFDPFSGFYLHKSTVTMMLVWLVLCFTGWLGPVANMAHLFGLLIGMGLGFVFSQLRPTKF